MAGRLRLTLAQLNPTVGDVDGNAAKILNAWLTHEHDTDVIVFPELFLSGYPPEDLVQNAAFIHTLEKTVEHICSQTKHFKSAAIIPTPWISEEGYCINALLVVEKGQITTIQAKVELPNYSVFDEMRTFAPGPMPAPVTINGTKIGFLICEDFWHDAVARHLTDQGAEILIALNASPYDDIKYEQRLDAAQRCVQMTGLSLIYLNMVGGQDELIFDGRSFMMHANGQIVHHGHPFAEDILHAQVMIENEETLFEETRSLLPTPVFDFGYHEVYAALMLGLKDYVHKNGFSKVILGLSGGIDSAVVASIAADALGPENVRCVMLPSVFTSKESLRDAEKCAKNLGVSYEILPIKEAVETFEKIIPDLHGLAHENTQSRIRGLILMALSNISGAMLLSTGNKSELATGYATLYGDMNGGFNPLKDVYKSGVYQLAMWRNREKTLIPESILLKPPSAELRADQTDQDNLPPYELLDNILTCLVEFDHIPFSVVSDALSDLRDDCLENEAAVEHTAKLLRASEFKRFQSCPGPRISPRAFGKDRRYPLTNKFLNRIEKPE